MINVLIDIFNVAYQIYEKKNIPILMRMITIIMYFLMISYLHLAITFLMYISIIIIIFGMVGRISYILVCDWLLWFSNRFPNIFYRH